MATACTHLDQLQEVSPRAGGCEECLASGGRWVHLRMCMSCGHIGCCDNSPGRHATGHYRETTHALIRSFEPGEDWWWCYPDELGFNIEGAPPAPSHP
ncbi:MAG: UBP-type zinc finger domain-containing protein [Actinobacteria bacterium]|nr:UBP-type zinc finger domain-containing protein [Actinomycetota bacterium]